MAQRKRILLADDSNVVTTVLATALEKEGFSIEVAVDGQTAFDLGKTGEFDLAVLDQLMPGLLGLEVIERWHDEGIEMPVLILTAVADDATAVQSMELGAADFVRKPFHLPELIARIRSRLAN
jgi:DNA-binding response OmpR family regulator